MGIMGNIRADGLVVTSTVATDEVAIQRIDSSTGQRTPRLITVQNFLSTTPGGYTPTAVLFANASGDIAGDATNLNFNDSTFVLTVGGNVTSAGNLIANTAGGGLQVKSGSNARIGTATMASGTVTVTNTSVTANTRIFLTVQSLGTVSAPKAIAVTTKTANTSFVITSADATDTSVVAWMLVESL